MRYLTVLSYLNEDITELTAFLDKINYFNSPYSTAHYRAYEGGLCEQALDVYIELCRLTQQYWNLLPNPKPTEADLIKIALLRDVYRAVMYIPSTKNVKNDATGTWEAVKCFTVTDNRPYFGDIYFGSYMLIKNLVSMSDEVIEAITQATTNENYAGDIYSINRSYPTVALTKMAVTAVTSLVERWKQEAAEDSQ